VGTSDRPNHEQIDAVLADWRQGDCVLGEQWFLFRLDPSAPLTPEAAEAAAEGADAGEAEVRGLMIATQTCDLVRGCRDRHFVDVSPLVEVDDDELGQIERGRRPRYTYVPGVAAGRLVADLDRIMTVEKAVVASWARTAGSSNDGEIRELARALARKRGRFAFPDDFTSFARKLQSRLQDKHGKNSDEGRALRSLREIRAHAAPSWDANGVQLMFWFLRNEDTPDFEGRGWDEQREKWLKLLPASGRFQQIDGIVTTLDDITARDYVESDPLDLDHLSPLDGE
jgi:hypothetical protein